jgi:hypothetical protein
MMIGERYVGERRALQHFLSELQPLVIDLLGRDSVLWHRIDRSLKIGDLDALRRARETFHNQPDDLKRRLMRGIFEGPAGVGEQRPLGPELINPDMGDPAMVAPGIGGKAAVIRFDAVPAACDDEIELAASLQVDAEIDSASPVRVLIRPGTLPGSAATALRRVADWIERDRRMLSRRRWAENPTPTGPSGSRLPAADRSEAFD